jgi:hypothetical protein
VEGGAPIETEGVHRGAVLKQVPGHLKPPAASRLQRSTSAPHHISTSASQHVSTSVR